MYMYKRTNIELDVDLVKKAMEVTHIDTIREVVHHSLRELIRLNKRRELLNLKGKIKWEGNLNEMRSNE
jgi:Arc/MetJ family transcription regulator